ncbi:IclR family transcriptional regulator [Williamsia muralis]|uniref:IclR family transcriptional regulator n=1 Tax=Williamsia marianensis TaxID=85044 RepID=A0A2G3PK56_WILMA|nr:IclR family transcriptional regulator [Williamsia marianensis]PHV66184.1 IclR family transcriptional regulator [Williamsia marianensis]
MQQHLDPNSVLGKAIAILDAFQADGRVVPLSELASRTGIPKTTVHRIANDLVSEKLLARSDAGYRLGNRLFELGMRASPERGLLEVATPFMQDLFVRTTETVHLGLLDGDEVIYVSKIGGHRQAASPSRVGGRMPLYCTAIGKVLLASSDNRFIQDYLTRPFERRTRHTIVGPGMLYRQLGNIAKEGVAFEVEESTLGIVCLASPILDGAGAPIAALSVTGPAHRFNPRQHVDAVRAAADGVALTLARQSHIVDTQKRLS